MNKITIELDSKWQKRVRSPLYYVVATLQGVAITFAPLFLYWCGKGKSFGGYENIVAGICFAVIFLVSSFYIHLGSAVVKELRKVDNLASKSIPPK